MKIAIFSEDDLDVSQGIDDLLTKYSEQSPEVLFPVKTGYDSFSQSIIRKCLENSVKVTAHISDAVDVEHILQQVDSFVVCEDPVQDVLRQLSPGDAIGIVWTDSLTDHLILHSIEDLALDTWDITEGMDAIELEPDDLFAGMDSDELHDGMHKALGVFVDLMSAYIASTVMDSLGQAVVDHLMEQERKKDVSPFEDEE
jgi:hypothetical protein